MYKIYLTGGSEGWNWTLLEFFGCNKWWNDPLFAGVHWYASRVPSCSALRHAHIYIQLRVKLRVWAQGQAICPGPLEQWGVKGPADIWLFCWGVNQQLTLLSHTMMPSQTGRAEQTAILNLSTEVLIDQGIINVGLRGEKVPGLPDLLTSCKPAWRWW